MSLDLETPPTAKSAAKPRAAWMQGLWITMGALGLFVLVRLLPTGTNLSHMDFRAGANSIEFCDPANPQFIPVTAVRSPVEMTIASGGTAAVSQETAVVFTLMTLTGKLISAEDLLEVHTQKLHLLIVDPTLEDYQHVHPVPRGKTGEWAFTFVPRRAGIYRVFADFTPAATNRGLYAGADIEVRTGGGMAANVSGLSEDAGYKTGDYSARLDSVPNPAKAGTLTDFVFSVSRKDGTPVSLEPVMGAFAHLVAFDQERSGFAHLHPTETDLSRRLDPQRPRLNFKVTFPKGGAYVVWAQLNVSGRELFFPFRVNVNP